MRTISRRQFVATAAGLPAAVWGLRANPLGLPIGFQSWVVRDQIAADFSGTLRELAGVGYRTVEMCSPPGYSDSGFGGLAKMKGAEMRGIIEGGGLHCRSCHFDVTELREHLDDRIAWAKDLGLTQMILSSFDMPKGASMDDWRRSADGLNRIGEKVRAAGMQLGYHNHNNEFARIEDALIYDELMKRFDAKLVKMQFQVAVISLGFKAETYLTQYPGRFISMHLADWSPASKKSVALGQGAVDWRAVFAAAKVGGVQNYFVEVNDLAATMASFAYLQGLEG